MFWEIEEANIESNNSEQFNIAYKKVKLLVEEFQQHSGRYMKSNYKEHEARVDFINPFFEALGWDVSHNQQRDPFRQEVKGEKTEREGVVDYSFYLAPDFKNPVFFVEAKKPSVEIESETYYLQTIKYSWNAGLPVSILTDFQQLHILDCRNKAKAGDGSAFAGDHRKYTFVDYLDKEKFATIYYTFSREAVALGNIQKYTEQLRKPKGKTVQTGLFKGAYRTVDDDFLSYIDEVRELLAKALKKNNENLDSEALTEATVRIIDRLVFIRFLEDKQILDDYLIDKLGEKTTAWIDFSTNCQRLNTEYNGVVFKKHFIDDKAFAGPDDKMFRDILRDICNLNTPYNFRYIPIHILGSIYEQFLGKVVHATDKRVKIEEKPEVRKAGGVYYTPKYIVEYIVDNTIGKQVSNKTPKEISKLRFADIACGSGSFLISVYEHLLDYHTVYYNKHENIVAAQKDGCRKDEEGVWQLSIEQKQDILRNNVYGVDIDAQAVEVTQLSLYLKMLENENEVTVANHLNKKGRLFGADKILPDLSNNIKCGNSLIGSDIHNGQLFADEELKKLNPFDYETEFKEVFKQGGFDAIVGNPPWVDIKELPPVQVRFYFETYNSVENRMNLYAVFIEKCLKIINKNGRFGYIIPSSILYQSSYTKLRNYILNNNSISTIVRLPDNTFKNVKAETAILILNEKQDKAKTKCIIYDRNDKITFITEGKANLLKLINQKSWEKKEFYAFDIYSSEEINALISKIETDKVEFGSICDFCLGLTPYDKYKGHTEKQIEERVFHSETRKDETFKKLLAGSDVLRYSVKWGNGEYISYGSWLGAPRENRFFKGERILVRQIVSGNPLRIFAGLSNEELYNQQSIFNILRKHTTNEDLKYILALINSRLMNFYHAYKYLDLSKNLFQKILIQNCKKFPIKQINFQNKTDKAAHDHIVTLVTQMLESKQKLSEAKTDKDGEFYTRKCDSLDKQIDEAVFNLYGLSEEEKQIVLNS